MRILNFAKRNFKELSRDLLSIIFTILLPLFLLFLFQQLDIPNEVFSVENFTPSIIIFSFSFITLFTATLVANDRKSSLLIRLGTSPMKPYEYILGYALSVLPIIILQNVLFFILAIILGLDFSINIIFTIVVSILLSIMFVMLGILIGSSTSEKASSGIGTMLVQVVVFTSGMYFSTDMMGKVFQTICDILPFKYAVDITRNVLAGSSIDISSILIFSVYSILIIILSIITFKKKMVSDNK